jgi:hypothetical protein
MKKNNSTFTNTDGWGNKLVTIFALHLDSFIMRINFSLIYQIRDFCSGQIMQPRQLYLSPGFAKIAPYPPCTVTAFWLKIKPDSTRMLRRVTFTTTTAGPLVKMRLKKLASHRTLINF